MSEEETVEKKEFKSASEKLFQQLKRFSKIAVKEAKVNVPITEAIIKESKRILQQLYKASSVEEFNNLILTLIATLQRPVATGDGKGVKRLLATGESDYKNIIEREQDLIQAMEGAYTGKSASSTCEDFSNHNIEVYIATDRQREQVLSHLSDDLKQKVKQIYRVIPQKQQKAFNEYLKKNHIKAVKQLWHGSRNQNWMSIVRNGLLLNPDAIITGKMFGNGICVKCSTITCI